MKLEFNNGIVDVEYDASPSGDKFARIRLSPTKKGCTMNLYEEISDWVKTQKIDGEDCEHTVLLMKHKDPYMVVFKKVTE